MNRNKTLIYIVLVIMSFVMLVPFVWMILTAFKTVGESTQMDPFVIFPSHFRFNNFNEVLHNVNFGKLYFNTVMMIALRVLCAVLTSTIAGYAFARLNFRGKNLMFGLC